MSIEEKFSAAVNVIKNLPKDGPYMPSNEILLRFYSYFKQATEGPCTQPKPAFWEVIKKAKWDAWRKLGSMPKEEAMNCYIEELKEVILQIVETMSFTDKVADFMDNVGPFYEMVELPLPKAKSSYDDDEDQENGESNDNAMTIFITSKEVDNCKYLGCTLRAGRPRSETNGNAVVNGTTSNDVSSQKPGWDSVEAAIQANGSVPMKDSYPDNFYSGTESDDDEFSDPVETDAIPECNGDAADSGYTVNGSEHINGSESDLVDEHNKEETANGPVNLLKQNGVEHEKGKPNGPVDGITHRGGGDPMAIRPASRPFDSRGQHHSHSSGNMGLSMGTSSSAGRLSGMASGGGHGRNPGGRQKIGDVTEQIAQALAHLQQDMESVLARLNTLEALTIAHHNIAQGQMITHRSNLQSPDTSKMNGYSWWPFKNMSFKSVAFFLAWPVVLHLVFTILAARRARRKRR